jgi:hypothetical protein
VLVLLVVSSKNCDGRASFGQAKSNAAANSTITTSYDSHPTGKIKERRHVHWTFLVSNLS